MEKEIEPLKKILKNSERVAEINLERTPHSHFMDFTLLGKAGEIVPKLVEN